jgi:hypothetical protein
MADLRIVAGTDRDGPPVTMAGLAAMDFGVTTAELAAMDFAAAKFLEGQTKDERLKRSHELMKGFREIFVIAVESLAMSRTELLAKATQDRDSFWNMLLLELAETRKDAELVSSLLRSAELRLAAVMATVEQASGGLHNV